MSLTSFKESVLKNKWKSAGAIALGLYLARSPIQSSFEKALRSSEEQKIYTQIDKLSGAIADKSKNNCRYVIAPTGRERKLEDSVQGAIQVLKQAYDDPRELVKVLQFLDNENVNLISAEAYGQDPIHAVLFNDPESKQRTLILKQTNFNIVVEVFSIVFNGLGEDSNPMHVRQMIDKMYKDAVLDQRGGAHVMFERLKDTYGPSKHTISPFEYNFSPGVSEWAYEHELDVEEGEKHYISSTWGDSCKKLVAPQPK